MQTSAQQDILDKQIYEVLSTQSPKKQAELLTEIAKTIGLNFDRCIRLCQERADEKSAQGKKTGLGNKKNRIKGGVFYTAKNKWKDEHCFHCNKTIFKDNPLFKCDGKFFHGHNTDCFPDMPLEDGKHPFTLIPMAKFKNNPEDGEFYETIITGGLVIL